MLTHGPRQAHVWLIFDVRQKMTPVELNSQIGSCLVQCQHIELNLASLLIFERRDPALNDPAAMLREFAKVREAVLGRLKKELIEAKVDYIDYNYLDSVIEKRNWLIHHLILDPRYVHGWNPERKEFDLDLSEELAFFDTAVRYFHGLFLKRGAELGYRPSALDDASGKILTERVAAVLLENRRMRSK